MNDKNIAKKEKAIELLKQMDIYAPYIKGFREKDMVCFFERFGGYWADQEPELHEKMKALEKKYNCLVYEGKQGRFFFRAGWYQKKPLPSRRKFFARRRNDMTRSKKFIVFP